jgi:hypothetical protein
MHSPFFARLIYKQRSEELIADVCNGVKNNSNWTSELDRSKMALGMRLH